MKLLIGLLLLLLVLQLALPRAKPVRTRSLGEVRVQPSDKAR